MTVGFSDRCGSCCGTNCVMKQSSVRGSPNPAGGGGPNLPAVVDVGELRVMAEIGPDGSQNVLFPPDPYVNAANNWFNRNFVGMLPLIQGRLKDLCADMMNTFAYNHEKELTQTVMTKAQIVQLKNMEVCEFAESRLAQVEAQYKAAMTDVKNEVDGKFQKYMANEQVRWYAMEPRVWFLSWLTKALSAPGGHVRKVLRSLILEVMYQ